MKNIFLAIAVMAVSLSANATEQKSEGQRVVVECRGYVGKVSVFLQSSMPQNDPTQAVTSVEVGLVVKTWQPKQEFYYEEPKTVGGDLAIEGTVEADKGSYAMSFPSSWISQVSEKSTSFRTGLTIKGGIVNGNVEVHCNASLKEIKKTNNYSI